MQSRRRLLAVGAVFLFLILGQVPDTAAYDDARRAAMVGVTVPGKDLRASNPAWHGFDVSYRSRAIPIPLGLVAGVTANTDGMGDLERIVTQLQAAYPFFEVELKPEDQIGSDIEIEVGRDQLRVDLGPGLKNVTDSAIETDFLVNTGLFSVGMGPMFTGVNFLFISQGGIDMDDALRSTLQGETEYQSSTSYQAHGAVEAQAALALEIGTSFKVASWGSSYEPWNLRAGLALKGLMGIGYLDSQAQLDLVTGDPIFDTNAPLDVTYEAAYRINEQLGWGAGVDLGLAAMKGPWGLGLSVENLGSQIRWNTERRIEELDEDGNSVSRVVGTKESVVSKIPTRWMGNIAYKGGPWFWAGDVSLEQRNARMRTGVERRFGWFAARGGVGWSGQHGMDFGVGAGVGMGGASFDLSVRTHPYLYSAGRGLFMGASVGLGL